VVELSETLRGTVNVRSVAHAVLEGARVGAQLEPHCSAVGKVLPAHRTDDEVRRILGDLPMRRLTSTTITDPAKPREELASVRKVGVAYDVGEAISEVHCVAAPVRDDIGVVVAAVSVTVPENRFARSKLEFTAAVKAAAADISSRLADAEDTPAEPLLDDPFAGSERR
jgi:DNA-binding IclR family transcriptional regulator